MKVKLVKEHGLKCWSNFEEHRGKVFEVVSKLVPLGEDGENIELGNLGNGGYTVDLAPLGYPRVLGWMYDDEVEIVDDSTPVSIMKTKEPEEKDHTWTIVGVCIALIIFLGFLLHQDTMNHQPLSLSRPVLTKIWNPMHRLEHQHLVPPQRGMHEAEVDSPYLR